MNSVLWSFFSPSSLIKVQFSAVHPVGWGAVAETHTLTYTSVIRAYTCNSTHRLRGDINNTWWRKVIGAALGHVRYLLAQKRIWLTDAEQDVCFCVCLNLFGYPHSPALSGCSTALLEEFCSQEGRATSTPLIFYWQGGFICLINSLFLCVMCFRKEESWSCGIMHRRLAVDCVRGVSCVSGCKCEKGVYPSAESTWWTTQWGIARTFKPLALSVSRGSPGAQRHPGSNTKAPSSVQGWVLLRVRHHAAPFKSPLVIMNYKAPNVWKTKIPPFYNLYQIAPFVTMLFVAHAPPVTQWCLVMIYSGLGPAGTTRECCLKGGREVGKGRICPPHPHIGESMAAIISFPGSQWKREEEPLQPWSV